MQIGIRVSLNNGNRGGGRKPVNLVPPTLTPAVIGQDTTVSLGTWEHATSLTADLLAGGVVHTSGLSEGAVVPLTPADDLSDWVVRVRATGAGGKATEAVSASLTVRYAPPEILGPIPDEVFDLDSGDQIVPVAGYFSGEGLSYAVSGAGAMVDPQNGEITIGTTVVLDGAAITVTAQNSGGSVQQVFLVAVEDEEVLPAGAPIPVYYSSFQIDQTVDFLDYAGSPASLAHDPSVGDGAIVFGAPGEVDPTAVIFLSDFDAGAAPISVPLERGREYQVLLRTALSGTGSNTEDTVVRLQDSASNTLWNSGDIGTGTHLLTIPPFAGSGNLRIRGDFKIRGTITGSKTYQVRELGIWDITESGGFPQKTDRNPAFWRVPTYQGVSAPAVDFGGYFSGNITSYSFSGLQPHSWSGSELTIAPAIDETMGDFDLLVGALNNELESIDPQLLRIKVEALTPLTNRESGISFTREVNRPFSLSLQRLVYGGAHDHAYQKISGPSWLTLEANGHVWGYAPGTPSVAEDLVIRVIDKAGQTLDVTIPITVVAERDRTSPVDIPSGEVMTWLKAYSGSGRVFRLLDANTYTWGNGYQAVTQAENDPYIVIGETIAAEITGPVDLNQCTGLIFEGFTASRSITTSNNKDARSAKIVGMQGAAHVHFYDMVIHGNRLTVSTSPDDSADPGVWQNAETFVTMGVGLTLSGNYLTAHNCTFHDTYAAINISRGHHAGVFNCLSYDFGIDGITIDQTEGAIVRGCTFRNPVGNYSNSTHRDLFQTFANNTPMPRAYCWIDNFGSVSGVNEIQGHLLDLDGVGNTDETPMRGTNYRHIHRGNAVFASTNGHGFQCERFYDGVFDRMVVVQHPDNADKTANWDMRRRSQIALSNSVVTQYSGADFNAWQHLCSFTNMVEMLAAGAPAFTDIFPNWNNTGLFYEDPREAVRDGQPASAARMWIDPNSAWAIANPNIGPVWLRTG